MFTRVVFVTFHLLCSCFRIVVFRIFLYCSTQARTSLAFVNPTSLQVQRSVLRAVSADVSLCYKELRL